MEKIAVIFIYCDYRDKVNQTLVNLIGSLTKQLILQAGVIPAAVWDTYKTMERMQKPFNLESGEAIIKALLQQFDRVHICVDALDECQPEARRQLLEFFKTITGTVVRLFVTGRPNVEAELATSLADRLISKTPIVANKEDIQIYLSQQISQDRYPEAMDEILRTQMADKIIEWSQGM